MKTKEYLSQVHVLDKKIEQRFNDAEEMFQLAFGLKSQDYSGERVQTSPDPDRQLNLIRRYIEIEQEANRMLIQFMDLRHKIVSEIQELEDTRMVELLYLRYVRYMRLEEIADTMRKTDGEPYSYDHIRRLHGLALQEFEKCHRNATF